MTHLIQATWPDVAAGTVLLDDLFRNMAQVERDCLGFLGVGTVHDLQPPLLTGSFPEVVRWFDSIDMGDFAFPNDQVMRRSLVRLHTVTVAIFVALSTATPEVGNIQAQYPWVPAAFDETYGRNRTLNGTVKLATLLSPARWVTAQQYGGQWYTGWMLRAQVQLRYAIGAN